ncbi:hypothetical protein QL285_002927 [Trifolium repens]|nr:hypothetical protein QL285_002927 [Trifolium repens]
MTLRAESPKPISEVVVDTFDKSIETATIDYPILLSPFKYKNLFEPQLDIQPYLNWIMPSEKPSRPPKILISDPFQGNLMISLSKTKISLSSLNLSLSF